MSLCVLRGLIRVSRIVLGVPEKVETGDGSFTYLHPEHGASYRSLKGAQSEARHVFLKGTGFPTAGSWRVLELGFGSGLNFAITLEAALANDVELDYTVCEFRPLEPRFWLVPDEWKQQFDQDLVVEHGSVRLNLIRARWQERPAPTGIDAYYHDPFGPAVNPDCWQADCFKWAAAAMKSSAILATYGASTAARQAMKEAGLLVGVLPGAAGKREMTVASLSPEPIAHARPWKRDASRSG